MLILFKIRPSPSLSRYEFSHCSVGKERCGQPTWLRAWLLGALLFLELGHYAKHAAPTVPLAVIQRVVLVHKHSQPTVFHLATQLSLFRSKLRWTGHHQYKQWDQCGIRCFLLFFIKLFWLPFNSYIEISFELMSTDASLQIYLQCL